MLLTPHTTHAIDILRVEHRDSRIGPCVYAEMLKQQHKHLETLTLIHNCGMDIILEKSDDPKTWNNDFGDAWRHNMRANHDNVRHPDNLLWQFGIHIDARARFIQQSAPLLVTDAADFVIATYTCPIHTWYLHPPDQQVAFLHDKAIRHPHIIDQHNLRDYVDGDIPTAPCMADMAPMLPQYLAMFTMPEACK